MKRYVKRWMLFAVLIFCVCAIVACLVFSNQDTAVSAENIESHARSFQGIPDEWMAETEIGNEVAALVFYPADSSDAIYSIYLCRGKRGNGYSFRAGGKISSVDTGITRFSIDGYDEFAYISLNKQKISKMTVDDGSNIGTYVLDSSKPLALVLPSNIGTIIFYDEDGKEIKVTERNFLS